MFNLFKASATDLTTSMDQGEDSPLSRFAPVHERSALESLGRLTRFEAQNRPRQEYPAPKTHVVPKRPARLIPAMDNEREHGAAPDRRRAINENAHLHEDSHIPLWVIRKALPERFSRPLSEDDDLAFQQLAQFEAKIL